MRCTHERVMFMKTKILIQQGCVVLGALALYSSPQLLYAHGYVSKPESRGLLCKQGKNTQCGGIVYEPHSLEGKNGFPSRGPADGHIASANLDAFSELDQQSPTRWSKVNIPTGSNAFSWTFTVNHNTRSFRYFITKNGWNPSAPLTRQSFEAQAFCEVDGKLQKPPMQVTHTCNVPQTHQGHHIILAVWDIGDTANAFYNVIDANIGTGSPITAPPPPQPPIKPTPTPTAPQPPANSSYDYVYPDNIKNYKAGTKVLGSDKKIYQCKPFPYTGWCTIHAPQYTPATGSHWNDAWTLLK